MHDRNEYIYKMEVNWSMANKMVVCPNHHKIIHDADSVVDRIEKMYIYPNGFRERLRINEHL